ncbi:MAG: DUF721 domain-containing protein [Endomicrobiales bacterium]
MAFKTSDELIGALKKQLGLDEKMFVVIQVWDKEAGEHAAYARLAGLKKGMLLVEVDSSVHFQELSLRRRELARKINQYFGGEKVIKSIQLKLKK